MITSPHNSPRILITGGNGQVASAIRHHEKNSDYCLIFCSHAELDISDHQALSKIIKQHQPDFIINTAAYTQVDQAELNQTACLKANYEGPKQLALACQQNHIPLIHLSTDYIFDGTAALPYTEDHPAHPLQVYGQSKWLGEEVIRQTCEQFIILRVSGIFSEYGHNFVKTMLRLAKEKPVLNIVSDQFTCPTYAGDIASTIFELIKNNQFMSETLHFCTGPAISWYEFANKIIPMTAKITPISTANYPTLAKRPLYSILNCEKIKNKYGITIPHWSIGLQKTIKILDPRLRGDDNGKRES